MNPPATRKTNARELALGVVTDVFAPQQQQRGAQAAFDYRARRSDLDGRDRAFAAELAYGAIKMRRLLDWYARPYLAGRAKPLPPAIAEILRLGIYQLVVMGGVDAHAAVFETVNLALHHGHRGTAGLVNAILRRVAAEPPLAPDPSDFESENDYLGTRYSLPTWIVAQLRGALGNELEAALGGLNAAPQHAVRTNALKAGVAEVEALLGERGIEVRRSPFVSDVLIAPSGGLADDPEARWFVQSEAAAIPVDLLAPAPGERVVDFCSGRGNKSLQIGAALGERGTLLCVERDERKAQRLPEILAHAGVTTAATIAADASTLVLDEAVDAALVDAPCSGIGVIGRHPEARWRKQPADGEGHVALQHALLASATRALRPGGRLVYSVCSIDPREGAHVVAALLAQEPALVRDVVPERFAPFRSGEGELIVPPGLDGRDGFFVAALRRSSG
ncbi:MAG: transcription antitermination factor NusB [Candidatus Baltobacteraceae bacterium]